jgi:hypothetical protein
MFIFGKGAKAGVLGEAYSVDNNNLAMQFDYRNVYANIMKDWMGVTDPDVLNQIFPDIMNGTADGAIYSDLQLATQNITGVDEFIGERFSLEDCYPNPARDKTTVHFKINSAYDVDVDMYDTNGKKVKVMVKGFFTPGEHKVDVDLTGMPAGNYIYELKTGFYKQSKKLVILK